MKINISYREEKMIINYREGLFMRHFRRRDDSENNDYRRSILTEIILS